MASEIPSDFNDTDFRLFDRNVNMMNNLFHFSTDNQIDKFIYLSSFGSMQNPKMYDVKDYYTLSKITGEHFCALMESHNIQTASLKSIIAIWGIL